ncbi:MAG: thiamine pyrophosphate-binding protein [Methylacidiphilales bacterium]|nr:thiamine pyrophosphate-binding protein [Candidatus Methylacidiphilales bacterium]MDW8350080.1 thiamine pyrophosphate-binding protein [Verrucomicrobiae bacterium]
MKVSEFIANVIAQLGVRHVFTVSGGGMLHILEAIRQHPDLEYVCNYHEQASAMSAEAYARVRESIGVCLVTFGPGATNAITGVMGAWQDSIPLLVISGQVKSTDTISGAPLRQRGIQEVDIIPIVKSFTKYAVQIRHENEIESHLYQALILALSGRPGPVWIDVPMDIQARQMPSVSMDFHIESLSQELHSDHLDPSIEAQFKAIQAPFSSANRPLLYVGNGVRLAHSVSAIHELVESWQIPIVSSWNAADIIPNDHPLYVGRPGIYGQRAANFALQNADFLLTIGTRLSIPQIGYEIKEFARAAYKVMIDIDAGELSKFKEHFQLLIQCDAALAIRELKKIIPPPPAQIEDWRQRCKNWVQKYSPNLPEYALAQDGLNSYTFCDWLSQHMPEDAIVVTDMGTSFTGTYQAITIRKRQRIITSSGLASMGYGIGSAVGASFADRQRIVICLTGDGGIQMNLQELMAIAHYRLPVKVVILNNKGYLTIRHTQNALFQGQFAASSPDTGVTCPDFQKIADAYGLPYLCFSSSAQLPHEAPDWLYSKGPLVCEVKMPYMQPLVPKVSFKQLPDGRLVSPPLEDLFPFLPREEFRANMLIPILEKE